MSVSEGPIHDSYKQGPFGLSRKVCSKYVWKSSFVRTYITQMEIPFKVEKPKHYLPFSVRFFVKVVEGRGLYMFIKSL